MKAPSHLMAAVFLDNRPGHRKQTLGVLDSLAQFTDLQTIEISVPHLTIPGEAGKWIKYFLQPGCSTDLSLCDFIIGTGSRTHVPMLGCKKKYHIPAITCMAPTPLLRRRFDLCFVPRHDAVPAADNIFYTDGPPNLSRAKGRHDPGQGLILIGGRDEKSHSWNDAGIMDSVAFIVQRQHNLRWTISSSPRTPEETDSGLAKLAAEYDNVHFIRFSDTGPGWIEKEYDKNMTVWVTGDSISMIYEALSSGCRVGILPVAWKRQNNKFQRSVDDLSKRGKVVSFAAWKEENAAWILSEPLDEARRCAREILKRWWPNRLQ
ncbi:MAG: ELM1/GtrOC1 family putative glycosyltransferase [Desulfobulbaceae bacterium]|nr:ELM1/GtrOC1 family putative glycosyltransferase [Desulfobulbaceae bacterium]